MSLITLYLGLAILAVLITIWARQAFFQPLNETLAERIVVHPIWFPAKRIRAAERLLMELLDQRLTWLYEQALLEPLTPSKEYVNTRYWIGKILILPFLQRESALWDRYLLVTTRREAALAVYYVAAGNWDKATDCFGRARGYIATVTSKTDTSNIERELAMVYWPYVWGFCLNENDAHSPRWPLSLVVSQPDWCCMFDLLGKLQGPAGVSHLRDRLQPPYQGYADIWLSEQ